LFPCSLFRFRIQYRLLITTFSILYLSTLEALIFTRHTFVTLSYPASKKKTDTCQIASWTIIIRAWERSTWIEKQARRVPIFLFDKFYPNKRLMIISSSTSLYINGYHSVDVAQRSLLILSSFSSLIIHFLLFATKKLCSRSMDCFFFFVELIFLSSSFFILCISLEPVQAGPCTKDGILFIEYNVCAFFVSPMNWVEWTTYVTDCYLIEVLYEI